MAEALISRLKGYQVMVADVSVQRLVLLRKKYKVKTTRDNSEAFAFGEVVVLAVKPQQMSEVLEELRTLNIEHRTQKMIISIAAGIPLDYLQKKLPGYPIIRAMPNNPCLVGYGITALAKGRKVSGKQDEEAKKIFRPVGEVVEVPEKWMDAVTGLSGSGPAFVYQAIEALIEGGAAAGLTRKVATQLALQTVLGSVLTAILAGKTPDQLTAMVASPGGTTVEGLKLLEQSRFKKILGGAVVAAARKSKAISKKWAL